MEVSHLIQRCIKKDPIAQEELYRLCYKVMINTCLRYGGDHDKAGMIFNNAMLRLFQAIRNYRDEGKFWSWAKTIVTNCCIDFAKKEIPNFKAADIEAEDEVYILPEALSTLSSKEIHLAISKLPKNAALVFKLFIYEGFSHRQIAETLNITEGTSKSQVNYARKLLFEKLQEYQTYKAPLL